MANFEWTLEKLRALPTEKRLSLYRNAKGSDNPEAARLVSLIVENDLPLDDEGGLPFDHPIMVEIAEICAEKESIIGAVKAAEQGLPPLAGMEQRIVAALGEKYGTHYTTHHAGRCIADEMIALGWIKSTQKPMPDGFVAKSATTFVKKGNVL